MKQTNDGAKPKKDSKLTYVKELTNTPNALDVIESKYQDIINKVNSLLIQEMLFEVAVLTDEEQDLKMDVLGTSRNQVSFMIRDEEGPYTERIRSRILESKADDIIRKELKYIKTARSFSFIEAGSELSQTEIKKTMSGIVIYDTFDINSQKALIRLLRDHSPLNDRGYSFYETSTGFKRFDGDPYLITAKQTNKNSEEIIRENNKHMICKIEPQKKSVTFFTLEVAKYQKDLSTFMSDVANHINKAGVMGLFSKQ